MVQPAREVLLKYAVRNMGERQRFYKSNGQWGEIWPCIAVGVRMGRSNMCNLGFWSRMVQPWVQGAVVGPAKSVEWAR
jgi:hypothetical protein